MKLVSMLLMLFVGQSLAQLHLGPIGDLQEVQCYECDGHGHRIPNCLNHKHTCHHDEVCKITYGDNQPTLRCQRKEDCNRETNHAMRNCTGGGVEVHHDECQKCCATSGCVDDLVNLLKQDMMSNGLTCPGSCTESTLQACVDSATLCLERQFCQVSKDDHGKVRGECKEDHELHHCQDELHRHACDNPVGHGPPHHGRCFWDCCQDNDCLKTHFGAYMTPDNSTMTTTVGPSTPAPTVAGNTLWERLEGDCKDQLQGDQCKQLVGSHDVCHDRLALSVCPETCGLCKVFNSSVCEDTVLNNGCENLLIHENVCNDVLAVFICPKTCNMCTELINSIVSSVIDGHIDQSGVTTTVSPSSFPTFDCADLDTQSCDVLDSMCTTSFVGVVCPDKCQQCHDAIHGGASTVMTSQITQDITSAPATTSVPTATSASTATSDATTIPTTGPAASNTTSNLLCTDHLNGMDCSQLKDVCSSVMAMSVCPKYCGLCS